MSVLAYAIARLIDLDPVTVTVERTTKVSQNGGFRHDSSTHGPYRVLLAQRGSPALRATTTVVGTFEDVPGWQLLAPPEAEFKAGPGNPDVEEEIVAPHYGRFRVVDHRPLRRHGSVLGWQAALEKIV